MREWSLQLGCPTQTQASDDVKNNLTGKAGKCNIKKLMTH